MKTDVVKFIEHFQNLGTIDTFTNGCCYWFAFILTNRFPNNSCIMYNPIDVHFAASIDGDLFDITGELQKTPEWVKWSEYEKVDELETERLYKYCINKLD